MRRLRVAYLPNALQPGGAEKQMLALAERLPRDRFQVDFLVISGSGAYDDRARAAGARLRFVGSLPPPNTSFLSKVVRRSVKTLRYTALARLGRYDIVDAWLYPADILAAVMRPLTGTPVIVAGRRNLGDLGGRLGRKDRLIGKLTAPLIDAVVANSGAVGAEALAKEGLDPKKLRIIRNGVEPPRAIGAGERAESRRELGVAEDELLIGCVANYRPVKRLDLLVDAFGAIAAAEPRVRLVLVGEGPSRGELQAQIDRLGLSDRVRLHGWAPDPARLYGSFDLVVQSSRSEGLPNALLEAAATGRPIVATAAGGTSEIVVDGETGLLVPIDDCGALAAALLQAVERPELRQRLGEAARSHVERVFGMDRFVAEFAGLYEELAAAKHLVS